MSFDSEYCYFSLRGDNSHAIIYYLIHPQVADEVIDPCSGYFLIPEHTLGYNTIYKYSYAFGLYLLIMYIVPLGSLVFFNTKLIKKLRAMVSCLYGLLNTIFFRGLCKLATDNDMNKYAPYIICIHAFTCVFG